MAAVIIYGIPNCDTTKKAMAWLNKNKIPFSFHDYKQEGISRNKLEDWCRKAGLDIIFNKRSTTWKELPAGEQVKATSQQAAIKIMMGNTSIIKRPVMEHGNDLVVGFKEEQYNKIFK